MFAETVVGDRHGILVSRIKVYLSNVKIKLNSCFIEFNFIFSLNFGQHINLASNFNHAIFRDLFILFPFLLNYSFQVPILPFCFLHVLYPH